MTILRAFAHPTTTPPKPQTSTAGAVVATWRDLPRIAVGHTRAVGSRQPSVWRMVAHAGVVARMLLLVAPIVRGEVWVFGRGTAVTMTPTGHPRTRRRVGTSTAVACTVVCAVVVVFPLGIVTVAVVVGGPAGSAGLAVVGGFLAALMVSLLAVAVTSLIGRSGDRIAVVRPGSSGRTVRLHDLARHPADRPGTGVALLAAVIRADRYADDTVVAATVSARLAGLYVEAGMSRQDDVVASVGNVG